MYCLVCLFPAFLPLTVSLVMIQPMNGELSLDFNHAQYSIQKNKKKISNSSLRASTPL